MTCLCACLTKSSQGSITLSVIILIGITKRLRIILSLLPFCNFMGVSIMFIVRYFEIIQIEMIMHNHESISK